MGGASTGHSHARPCFRRKTLRRCRNSEEADDVILIDVDSDHFDNAIIIDVPDSLPKKRQGSSILRKDKNVSLQTVIYIDDDESPEKFNSFVGASSGRSFKPSAEDFEDVDAEENPFIQDGTSRIMNDSSHQTVGRKGENDNEGEGTSPRSEEEDTFYTYVSVGGSSYRGQHSPSIQTEPEDHQYFEPGSSSCHNWKRFKKSSSYSSHNEQATKEVKKTKSCFDGNSDCGKASSVKDDVAISKCQNSVEVEADPLNFFPTHEFRESQVNATGCVNEMEHLESCDPHESGTVEKTYNLTSVRSSFMSSTLPDKQRNCSFTPSSDEVESVSGESSWFQNSSLGSRDSIKKGCHGENRRTVDVISLSSNIHVHIDEAKVGLDEFVSNSGEEDKVDDFHPVNGHAVDSVESCMLGEREKFKETDEYKRALEAEWASRQKALKIQAEEAQNLSQLQKRSKAENGHTMDSVKSCMIGEREKFKETDEYKRAMKEEWASRQHALKIQAQEAQHLRRLQKRRNAESMRLMDMERRQKERIEEMRSTQKKDEENMNLKEVIRAEVRTELNKLERACENMASLLHSFGIQIEGWPNPSPQEVQTAYKKAVLTFHPDRALRSDTRQQVEAEEKFKLMNRFKLKFSSVL